jgi:hypothetical protein
VVGNLPKQHRVMLQGLICRYHAATASKNTQHAFIRACSKLQSVWSLWSIIRLNTAAKTIFWRRVYRHMEKISQTQTGMMHLTSPNATQRSLLPRNCMHHFPSSRNIVYIPPRSPSQSAPDILKPTLSEAKEKVAIRILASTSSLIPFRTFADEA